MMIMENDELRIPDKYRKMSVAELDKEAKMVLKQIRSTPPDIHNKKKAAPGRKEIVFHI